MKKIFTFFLFSIIFILNTNISLSIEPDVFIQSTVNRAASTLSGNLSKDERISSVIKRAGGLTRFAYQDGLTMYRKFINKTDNNEI